MDIGMAIRAIVADIGKHQVHVALCTSHVLVHASQGIASCVVVEFGNVADRLPTGEGMTVLALNIQRPVRTARGFPLIRCRR